MASPPQITVVEEFKGVQGSTYPRVSALSQAPDHHRGEGATEPAGDVLHFLTEDLRPGAPHTLSSVVQSGWLTRWVPGVDNGQTDSVRWPHRSQGWATRGRGAGPGPCPVPVDAICPSTDRKEPWDSSHLVTGMDHSSIPGCGKLLPAVLTPGLYPEHPMAPSRGLDGQKETRMGALAVGRQTLHQLEGQLHQSSRGPEVVGSAPHPTE